MSNNSYLATTYFPVTHSVLSATALMVEVLPDYDIGTPVECKLWDRGLNDTYRVDTTDNRYIWLLGLHTGNAQDWGHGWMDDAYFDSGGAGGLKFRREWEAQHLNNKTAHI